MTGKPEVEPGSGPEAGFEDSKPVSGTFPIANHARGLRTWLFLDTHH
jgi:hypothetical protein